MPSLWAAAATGAAAVVVALVPVAATGWIVAAVLAAAVAADAARTPAPWRFAIARAAPTAVPLGGDADIAWTVTNPTTRAWTVRLADGLAPSLQAGSRHVAVRVPGAGRARVGTSIRPSRRGRFLLGEMAVAVTSPWRLVRRQASRHVAGELRVHPNFRSRHAAELSIRRERVLEVGLRSASGRGSGSDFDALRELVEGDDVRRVDWAATARAGKPIVRTYRAERNQTVAVLVDSGRVMAGVVDGVPRLDHAIDAALALATVSARVGDRCGLVAFGAAVRAVLPARAGSGSSRRFAEALFDVEPELAESDYRGALVRALALFPSAAVVVLLTELASQAAEATLVPALPLALRGRPVVVGAVADPAVDAWRRAAVTVPSQAYRAAAAVGARQQRQRTARVLSGLGARVVDAPPGALATAVVDAYLDLKATVRV